MNSAGPLFFVALTGLLLAASRTTSSSSSVAPPRRGESWRLMYGLSRPLTSGELSDLRAHEAARLAPVASVVGVNQAAGVSNFAAVVYVDLLYTHDSPAPTIGETFALDGAQATLIVADGPGAGGQGTRGYF